MDHRISDAAAGNSEALAELLFDHHDRLSRFIAGKMPAALRSTLEPDDVLQQVFVDAFRAIRSFQAKSDRAFYRWLETIAENRLTDIIRTQSAKKRGGDRQQVSSNPAGQASSVGNLLDAISAEMPTPSKNVAREEGVQALRIRLAELPEDYRQVIELRHLQGLSREEVAQRMGRSEAEVRGLLYRARKRLRDAMGNSSLYLTKK